MPDAILAPLEALRALLGILVFPGLLFLGAMGLVAEYVDRKLVAKLQNRVGPPFFQPFADFVKLAAKQEIIPSQAEAGMFKAMPILAMAATATSFLYVPLWGSSALFGFEGDLVVVLYLLTIPTLSYFLGGIYSTSLFAEVGAVRAVTQLFAYEVPLFLALLSPALLAGSWSVSGIAAYLGARPWSWAFCLVGFAVALVASLGKLEKVPFDIPDAETEIVGGVFTEYSGRLLAFIRMTIDIEEVVLASLLAAVFLPFGLGLPPVLGLLLYLAKVLAIVALLALLHTILARLRIDQMMDFCWKWLAPLAFLQLLACLFLKGALP
jgi:NADH-quinone oxidoreductase subunit H